MQWHLPPIHLPVCGSTNMVVKTMMETSAVSGLVVTAGHQTQGRGRNHHSQWINQPGKDLLCSLSIVPAGITAENFFLLSMAVAVGIVEGLKNQVNLGDQLKIKWPNDILLNGKKLCGILIEANWQGAFCQFAVAGFGLNVNSVVLQDGAASLATVFRHAFDLEELLDDILFSIGPILDSIDIGLTDQLASSYLDCLYGTNEWLTYQAENSPFEKQGLVQGVLPNGGITFRQPTGLLDGPFALNEVKINYR